MGGKSIQQIIAEEKGVTGSAPSHLAPTKDPERVLAMISELSSLIEQSTEIGQAVALRDRAEALRFLARKVELETEIKNRATIAVIQAKRKIGEMTLSTPAKDGTLNISPDFHDETPGKLEQLLNDYGLDPNEIYRNEALAKIDQKRLNLFIDKKLADGYEITVGAAIQYAKNVLKPKPTGAATTRTVVTESEETDIPTERVMEFTVPDAISWIDEYYDFVRNLLPDDVSPGDTWEIVARRRE